MASKAKNKFQTSVDHLKEALLFFDQNKKVPDSVRFSAVAKTFEVAVEYAWKEFKRHAESEGLEVVSPKDAVRQAAKLGTIQDAELWLKFVQARNEAVHDYFGMPVEDYVELTRQFLKECAKLKM